MNFQEAQEMKDFIIKTVRSFMSKNSPFLFYSAKVTATSGDYATVRLIGDTTDIPDVINKTQEVLSIGDRVVLMAKKGNLGDSVIHVRWENDIT